jgi:CopG family nickel-responsive transcriptional regulator
MDKVIRTGISFRPGVLKFFDKIIKEKGYTNRSEAINDILRNYIHTKKEKEVLGVITIIYDHRLGHYNNKISELQHEYHCLIKNSIKDYINHHNCLEVLIIKGLKNRINVFINKLKNVRGVKRVKIEFVW